MFKNIEQIEWDNLECSSGTSKEIPKFLNLLLSPNKEDRTDAFNELMDRIYDLGAIFPVTGYVIPFLIEILNDNNYPDDEEIVIKPSIIEIIKITLEGIYYCDKLPELTVRETVINEINSLIKYIKDSTNKRYDRLDLLLILSTVPELKNEIYPIIKEELKNEEDEIYRNILQEALENF